MSSMRLMLETWSRRLFMRRSLQHTVPLLCYTTYYLLLRDSLWRLRIDYSLCVVLCVVCCTDISQTTKPTVVSSRLNKTNSLAYGSWLFECSSSTFRISVSPLRVVIQILVSTQRLHWFLVQHTSFIHVPTYSHARPPDAEWVDAV